MNFSQDILLVFLLSILASSTNADLANNTNILLLLLLGLMGGNNNCNNVCCPTGCLKDNRVFA